MLAGMLKIENNRYYLYYDLNDERISYSIVCSNKDGVRCLNENEANKLIDSLFDTSNLKFINSFYNYNVYFDEVSNLRFFKDNKEDLSMFFKYNSFDATMYNNHSNDVKDSNKTLKAKISVKGLVKQVAYLLLCEGVVHLVVLPIIMHENGTDYRLLQKHFPKDISVSKAIELIDDSNNLTNFDKGSLINYDMFSDFFKYINEERYFELNERMNNIDIKRYGKLDCKHDSTSGYYSPAHVNNIYVNENVHDKDQYANVIRHEFVHLMQNSYCEYQYIHEACAEILSYEYYGSPMGSYTEEIKRVKALIEIIGPDVVMNCNFNDDYSSFENEIYKYLDKDDADKLLNYFSTSNFSQLDDEFINKLNANIDQLLKKMYFNKYGKDISESKIINKIYYDLAPERIYFNKNHPNYNEIIYFPNEDGEIFKVDPVFRNDDYRNYILDKNNIKKIVYRKIEGYREKDYENNPEMHSNIYDYEYRVIEGAREEWESTKTVYDNGAVLEEKSKVVYYKGVKYSFEEAYDNGLYEKYILCYNDIEITDYNSVVPNHNYDKILIYGNDGSYCEMEYYDNQWNPYKKNIPINEPTLPIYSTFNVQNIEDRFAGIDFNDDNEVKVEFTTRLSK